MNYLLCPVCGESLRKNEKIFSCKNNHSFDVSKEGYINLLQNHKNGSLVGDNKNMALSRRSFLQKGYFSILSKELSSIIYKSSLPCPVIVDACCGEGYYSEKILESRECELYGFDISKEMVRLAAKRKNGGTYFVANLSSIPLKDDCADFILHLFAPFHEKEFSRILKNSGTIITVVAGENHLFEMKEILYSSPYKNDEAPPKAENLKLKNKVKLSEKIHLKSKEDIDALFKMTPYFYHTKEEDKKKLAVFDEMDVTVEFVLFFFEK